MQLYLYTTVNVVLYGDTCLLCHCIPNLISLRYPSPIKPHGLPFVGRHYITSPLSSLMFTAHLSTPNAPVLVSLSSLPTIPFTSSLSLLFRSHTSLHPEYIRSPVINHGCDSSPFHPPTIIPSALSLSLHTMASVNGFPLLSVPLWSVNFLSVYQTP